MDAVVWYTGSMRRTATTPAPSDSTTQPSMSQALRAMVAQTRRRSMSGAVSVSSGAGNASMGVLLAGNEQHDGDDGAHDGESFRHRPDRDLVANGKGRVLHVELVG